MALQETHVLTGAELLVECLARAGVKVVFGMPGSHSVAVYDALTRRGSDPSGTTGPLRHILCRNEQAGAFMADGYARATGEIGVILTTAGPGATNAATGIAEAYSDGIPLLLISGQVDSNRVEEERGAYHEMDLQAFFQPITKWNALVRRIEELADILAESFRQLHTPRLRPVQISVPQDLWRARVHRDELRKFPTHFASSSTLHHGSPGAMQHALMMLRQAEAPVLMVGGGVVAADACAEVRKLSQRLRAPVMTTTMGKGAIPESDFWSLGHARSPMAREALYLSDMMLAIGCRFTEVVTDRWKMPVPKRLIQVDLEPDQIGANYRVEVGVVGDAKEVVHHLARELPIVEANKWDQHLPSIKSRPHAPCHWIISVMRELLPPEAIVMSDTCEMGHAMETDFPVDYPRTFNYPANFISLGWGLPAAIGAKVGAPEWTVVSVSGDGGFLMTSQELATLARYHLPVIAIVHNDNSYGAMKRIAEKRYEGRFFEMDLNNPNFVQYANALGVSGYRATSEASFRAALQTAISRNEPAVIEVQTEWRDWRSESWDT